MSQGVSRVDRQTTVCCLVSPGIALVAVVYFLVVSFTRSFLDLGEIPTECNDIVIWEPKLDQDDSLLAYSLHSVVVVI